MIAEYKTKQKRLQGRLREMCADGALITSNVNLFYFTGRIVNGYLYIPAEGNSVLFVRAPLGIEGEGIIYFNNPKKLPEAMAAQGFSLPNRLMLEDGDITANEYLRLQAVFSGCEIIGGSQAIRELRSIKTPREIELFRQTAQVHAQAYRKIPEIYRKGMTDREFSCAIEYELRKLGHLGLFRTYGFRMEAFMGSVLAGENANEPSPFDFALGGKGEDSSLPVGACGKPLEEGTTVMVDLSNNLFGYITDMSRTYAIGELPDKAYRAHEVSLKIQEEIVRAGKAGTVCSELYALALNIARESGFGDCFMGQKQQAKFVGHGIGIEINELPVLAPRMNTVLQENMVIALEPKFIVEGVGAVGTENSYVVTGAGLEKITVFGEEIVRLD